MENPLIDQRHFKNGPWQQEPIWVQRNALGIIVGMSEKPPQTGEIIPNLPKEEVNGGDVRDPAYVWC
jgi:hypothetical protein